MIFINHVYVWLGDNPKVVGWALIFLSWIAYNILKRHPPKSEAALVAWGVLERLCFLSWDRYGGSLKSLGIIFPDLLDWDVEKPTVKEGKSLPPKEGLK